MHYLIPLAYDYIRDGSGNGTMKRCNALIAIAAGFCPKNCWFGSLAGYTKESPGRPSEKVPKALCDQMKEYVTGRTKYIHFFSDPQAWGTYEEIRFALQKIKNEQRYNNILINHVYFSTNLGHSFRVHLCIMFLKRELEMNNPIFRYHIVIAKHYFSKKEWFQETVKFFQYLYKFVFSKF